MNKQELIDNAVHKFDGEWRYPDDALYVTRTGNYFYAMANENDSCFLCTADEFQQRARELGYGAEAAEPESWYDYANQKALRLPPLDYECEYSYSTFLGWKKCKYIGVNSFDSKKYAVIFDFESADYENPRICKILEFRPLDWNRKAEAGRKQLVDAAILKLASFSQIDFDSWEDILTKLYDAGFLRMPEDK
jgi:hypothetical protein